MVGYSGKEAPTCDRWFQLNRPLLEALRTMERRYAAETVVDELLSVFPEVEAWWKGRTVGPHLDILPSDLWRLANEATARQEQS